MAKYEITKQLKKCIPTVRLEDDVVKEWELEAVYSYNNFRRDFNHRVEVEYLGKKPNEYTKEELISFMPSVMELVFESHYETFNTPPTEERISTFRPDDLV